MGKPTSTRTAQRNGYRHRELDTRVGTLDVAIPKLRSGTYFPRAAERRKRAEIRRLLLPEAWAKARSCPQGKFRPMLAADAVEARLNGADATGRRRSDDLVAGQFV